MLDANRLPTQSVNPQEAFDTQYVSSMEICKRLKVHRATLLMAIRRGEVPEPILIAPRSPYLWERHTVEPFLVKWHERLLTWRNGPDQATVA